MTISMSSVSKPFITAAILSLASLPQVVAKGRGGTGGGALGGYVRIGIVYVPVIYFFLLGLFVLLVILFLLWAYFLKGTGRLQRFGKWLITRRKKQAVKPDEMREEPLDGTGNRNPITVPAGYESVNSFDKPYQPPHPVTQPYTYNAYHQEGSHSTFVIPAPNAGQGYNHPHHAQQNSGQYEPYRTPASAPYAQGGMGYTTNTGYAHPPYPPPNGPYNGANAV